jgi:hypothetical protein
MAGGVYTYRDSDINSTVLRVLNAVNSHSMVGVTSLPFPFSLSSAAAGSTYLLPPHARRVRVRIVIEFDPGGTAVLPAVFVGLITNGDIFALTNGASQLQPPQDGPHVWWVKKGAINASDNTTGAGTAVTDEFEIECDSTQGLAYALEGDDGGGVVPKLSLWVTGWRENR